MERVVWIIALIVMGTLVGIELGVATVLNPLASKLPDSGFRVVRGGGGRWLGVLMPFWYVGALALLTACAFQSRTEPAIAAVTVMVLALILTVTTLVPMNNTIGRWSTDAEVDRGLAARWDRFHWLRVAMLAVVLVALATSAPRFG